MKQKNTNYKYIIYSVIILLLIILILPFIIYPLLFENIIGLINPKKNEPLDVVIAHYKEDLTWVDVMIPENARVFIYTKSDETPNCKRPYIHKYLKNVGREVNTYLYHIITNYKNNTFNDNILFLPGSVDLIHKKIPTYLLLNNIGKMNFNTPFIMKNNIFLNYINDTEINSLKNNGYESSYKDNNESNNDVIVYKFNTISEFTKYFDLKQDFITYKGIFLIKKHLIYNRPREYYIEFNNHVNNCDNAMNSHFMERCWHSVFNP
jgi:hypothetical protein